LRWLRHFDLQCFELVCIRSHSNISAESTAAVDVYYKLAALSTRYGYLRLIETDREIFCRHFESCSRNARRQRCGYGQGCDSKDSRWNIGCCIYPQDSVAAGAWCD